jgi:hypothetical protein
MSVFVFSAITFSACAVLFEDVFGEIFLFMRERGRVRVYDLYGLRGDSLVQVCDMRFAHM